MLNVTTGDLLISALIITTEALKINLVLNTLPEKQAQQ